MFVAQLFTIAFIIESIIEIPDTYANGSKKPLVAFALGVIFSLLFGVGVADALELTFVTGAADYAYIFDALLVGLFLARGSGFLNTVLNRQ